MSFSAPSLVPNRRGDAGARLQRALAVRRVAHEHRGPGGVAGVTVFIGLLDGA